MIAMFIVSYSNNNCILYQDFKRFVIKLKNIPNQGKVDMPKSMF